MDRSQESRRYYARHRDEIRARWKARYEAGLIYAPKGPQELTCDGCGQTFVVQGVGQSRRRWCSPFCKPIGIRPGMPHEKSCAWCAKRFTTTRSRKLTCSPECSERRKRNKQDQYGSRLSKAVKRKILARDGWRCYLCNRAIPKSSAWPHPLAGTVDHVIPWSAGGSDDPSNLRAAHWHCNEEKGDRLLGIEMGFSLEAA